MAGKPDMTLHGLRQLAEWSIEHACMEPKLKAKVRKDWGEMWAAFCKRVVDGEFTIKDGGKEVEGDLEGGNRPAGGVGGVGGTGGVVVVPN